MKELLKKLKKTIFYCFSVYVLSMFPVMLTMFLLDGFFTGKLQKSYVYILFSLITLILLFIALNFEYDNMFSITYKEAANIRLEIAEKLKNLPLEYFSKHNLSDLSQTIMADVEGIEHSMSHAIPKAYAFYIFSVLLTIMMLKGNLKLGLAVILPFLLSFLFLYLSRIIQINGHKKYYKQLRENSEIFQETIELHQEIESFNLQDEVKENLYKIMDESEKIHVKENNKSIVHPPLSLTLSLPSTLSPPLSLPLQADFSELLGVKDYMGVMYFITFAEGLVPVSDARVRVTEERFEGVEVVVYQPLQEPLQEPHQQPQDRALRPAIIYLHGGGWCLGSSRMYPASV